MSKETFALPTLVAEANDRTSFPEHMSENTVDQITEDTTPLKDGSTSFGSFFPKNYVLAVFKTDAEAARAGDALRAAGFAEDDVIIASGREVVEYHEQAQSEQGLLAKLGEKWSRLYTDEAADADALMDLAAQGAAFVLAYAPDQELTDKATEALRPLSPPIFRKYDKLKITELV